MAKRANSSGRNRAKTTNPISHVVYQARDLSGVETPGGGGGKELVSVTDELRQQLRNTVAQSFSEIAQELRENPDIPSVLVVRLRDIAIAKSHRPIGLMAEAGLEPAGHAQLNEMLVTASSFNLAKLDMIIAQRDTKQIRANLSAVDGFEAWGIQRRLPKNLRAKPLGDVYQIIRGLERRLVFKLFSHQNQTTSNLIAQRFSSLLASFQATYSKLEQRIEAPLFLLEINDQVTLNVFEKIIRFQGIKQIFPEPYVWPTATVSTSLNTETPQEITPLQRNALPIVSVFDTGIAPTSGLHAPWVASRDTYVLPPETDYFHGTAVSSLVVDAAGINDHHPHFPIAPCRIHDVCALESNGSRISDLILRLRDAVKKRADIKIWNLSLGGAEISDDEFSDFGRELDALSDTYGVLFVVAAGNYEGLPRRSWPVVATGLADRLSSPGDSVRALTIGALTHLENAASLVRTGEPAGYSRRGPGPVFTPKPDIVHIGGNTDGNLDPTDVGVQVLAIDGGFARLCGTSFASPIAAAMAAHTWQALLAANRTHAVTVTPNLVKALLIHSAQLNSPERPVIERRYFGAGMPTVVTDIFYDSDDSFTMLFELDIADTTKWRKAPFPIPSSLLVDGKFRGEVVITAAYAPPLNPTAGAEYVRFNVDVGFGTLTPDEDGKLQFHGQVPAEGELGTTGFENAQVEHGAKWSPIKTYRRAFPKGKTGNNWALQATIVRRAFEPPLAQPLRVIILVTLRSLDGNDNIYAEGQKALAATNWITQSLVQRIEISV